MAKIEDYFPNGDHTVSLDWKKDPIMCSKANEFVKLTSKEGIWSMLDQGRNFASVMEKNSEFALLPKV